MNVFVLSTGRTATTALAAACKHIENYSCAHESRVGVFASKKLDYPDNHIEIDNRLVWFTQQLDDKYGDNAKYVHLTRDREKVAASYCERWNLNESIVKAFGHGILMRSKIKKKDRMAICLDYVDLVDSSIQIFLKNKSQTLTMRTETLKDDFSLFWQFIGASGDFEKTAGEFNEHHNMNQTSWLSKVKNALAR